MPEQPSVRRLGGRRFEVNGVEVELPGSTERFGHWLIRNAGSAVIGLQKHPKAIGRLVAYGAPLLAAAGAALGLPPGAITAATALLQAVTGAAGDLPICTDIEP